MEYVGVVNIYLTMVNIQGSVSTLLIYVYNMYNGEIRNVDDYGSDSMILEKQIKK